MSSEIQEISVITDEDTLKKMWQEAEDFAKKKEIRSHMYKLREERLKSFYESDDVDNFQSNMICKVNEQKQRTKEVESKIHADALMDESFISFKSKEIRDSSSPIKDLQRQTYTGNVISSKINKENRNEISEDGKTRRDIKSDSVAIVKKEGDALLSSSDNYNQVNYSSENGDDYNRVKTVGSSTNQSSQQQKIVTGSNSMSFQQSSSSKFESSFSQSSRDYQEIKDGVIQRQNQGDDIKIARNLADANFDTKKLNLETHNLESTVRSNQSHFSEDVQTEVSSKSKELRRDSVQEVKVKENVSKIDQYDSKNETKQNLKENISRIDQYDSRNETKVNLNENISQIDQYGTQNATKQNMKENISQINQYDTKTETREELNRISSNSKDKVKYVTTAIKDFNDQRENVQNIENKAATDQESQKYEKITDARVGSEIKDSTVTENVKIIKTKEDYDSNLSSSISNKENEKYVTEKNEKITSQAIPSRMNVEESPSHQYFASTLRSETTSEKNKRRSSSIRSSSSSSLRSSASPEKSNLEIYKSKRSRETTPIQDHYYSKQNKIVEEKTKQTTSVGKQAKVKLQSDRKSEEKIMDKTSGSPTTTATSEFEFVATTDLRRDSKTNDGVKIPSTKLIDEEKISSVNSQKKPILKRKNTYEERCMELLGFVKKTDEKLIDSQQKNKTVGKETAKKSEERDLTNKVQKDKISVTNKTKAAENKLAIDTKTIATETKIKTERKVFDRDVNKKDRRSLSREVSPTKILSNKKTEEGSKKTITNTQKLIFDDKANEKETIVEKSCTDYSSGTKLDQDVSKQRRSSSKTKEHVETHSKPYTNGSVDDKPKTFQNVDLVEIKTKQTCTNDVIKNLEKAKNTENLKKEKDTEKITINEQKLKLSEKEKIDESIQLIQAEKIDQEINSVIIKDDLNKKKLILDEKKEDNQDKEKSLPNLLETVEHKVVKKDKPIEIIVTKQNVSKNLKTKADKDLTKETVQHKVVKKDKPIEIIVTKQKVSKNLKTKADKDLTKEDEILLKSQVDYGKMKPVVEPKVTKKFVSLLCEEEENDRKNRNKCLTSGNKIMQNKNKTVNNNENQKITKVNNAINRKSANVVTIIPEEKKVSQSDSRMKINVNKQTKTEVTKNFINKNCTKNKKPQDNDVKSAKISDKPKTTRTEKVTKVIDILPYDSEKKNTNKITKKVDQEKVRHVSTIILPVPSKQDKLKSKPTKNIQDKKVILSDLNQNKETTRKNIALENKKTTEIVVNLKINESDVLREDKNNEQIIVNLRRSTSSRETTPDQPSAYPCDNDENLIPRYPDEICEPDDVLSRSQSINLSQTIVDETEELQTTKEETSPNTVNKYDEKDECLLSVNEKVNKFVSEAQKLMSPIEPKSPTQKSKQTSFLEQNKSVKIETKDEKDAETKGSVPNSKESSPSRRVCFDTEVKKVSLDDVPRLGNLETPKSSKIEPKNVLSPSGRLRSNESIQRAKQIFEKLTNDTCSRKTRVSPKRDMKPVRLFEREDETKRRSSEKIISNEEQIKSSFITVANKKQENNYTARMKSKSPSPVGKVSKKMSEDTVKIEQGKKLKTEVLNSKDKSPLKTHFESFSSVKMLKKSFDVPTDKYPKISSGNQAINRQGKTEQTVTITSTKSQKTKGTEEKTITDLESEENIENINDIELLETMLEQTRNVNIKSKIQIRIQTLKKVIQKENFQKNVTNENVSAFHRNTLKDKKENVTQEIKSVKISSGNRRDFVNQQEICKKQAIEEIDSKKAAKIDLKNIDNYSKVQTVRNTFLSNDNGKDTNFKVSGTITKTHLYSKNGEKPRGEVSITKYSSDPSEFQENDQIKSEGDILTVTLTKKIGSDSQQSEEYMSEDYQFDQRRTSEKDLQHSKLSRKGSVKEISKKFIENAIQTSKNEKQKIYPRAGLILRSSSFKDSKQSGDFSREKVCTTSEKKTATSTGTFLSNHSKVTGVQDVIARIKNAENEDKLESAEDTECRLLLNKFLGCQALLSGMESASLTSSEYRVTSIKKTVIKDGKPSTIQLTFTHPIKKSDIKDIEDIEILKLLLQKCETAEDRQTVQSQIDKIMAEKEVLDGKVLEAGKSTNTSSINDDQKDVENETKDEVKKEETPNRPAPKPLSPFAKFKQLDKQNSCSSPSSPNTPTASRPLFKFTDPDVSKKASTIKERLLQWVQMKTKEYENISIDNFSGSWADGLAFCALIHHFLPDAFDYKTLTPKNRRHNFTLAFKVAEEKAGIYPLLDVEDMVMMPKPDWKCVFTYVQAIYRRFKDEE